VKAQELFDLTGQVAFVTGAASGLGLAFAEVLAANGAAVAMLDVDEAALAETSAAIRTAGGEVETHLVDVSDKERLFAVVDDIAARRGRLDIAFANAGVSGGRGFYSAEGHLENMPDEVFERALAVNLTGSFNTLRAAAKHMKKQGSGRIVMTSSVAGLRAEGMVGYGYTSSKAAIVGIVRHAARELAPHNVLVNAIAPGPFLTNIAGGRVKTDPEAAKAFSDMVPLKRIAHTDEIKGLALLLASPAGSFITGITIPIDGGVTAG